MKNTDSHMTLKISENGISADQAAEMVDGIVGAWSSPCDICGSKSNLNQGRFRYLDEVTGNLHYGFFSICGDCLKQPDYEDQIQANFELSDAQRAGKGVH